MLEFTPVFFLLTFLAGPLVLLTEGTGDPIDHLDSAWFWKTRGLEMTVANLLEAANPPSGEDVTGLLAALGAPEFRARQAAEKALLALGPGILPQLRGAARAEDPEVAERALRIVRALAPRDTYSDLQRLMAIRTLGELGREEALPVLARFMESGDPATREYAARARARIEKKPLPRRTPDAQSMARSFHVSIDGHALAALRPAAGEALSLPALLARSLPEMGNDPAGEQASELQSGLVQVLEKTGAFRVDLLTLRAGQRPAALGEEPKRWFSALVTGRFDTNRMVRAVEEFEAGPDGGFGLPKPVKRIRNGVTVYELGGEIAFLFISPRHLAFAYMPGQPPGFAANHCLAMQYALRRLEDAGMVNRAGPAPLNVMVAELSEKNPVAAGFLRRPGAPNAQAAPDAGDPFPALSATFTAHPAKKGWDLEASALFADEAPTLEQRDRLVEQARKILQSLDRDTVAPSLKEALKQLDFSTTNGVLSVQARSVPAGIWVELPQAFMMLGLEREMQGAVPEKPAGDPAPPAADAVPGAAPPADFP